MVKWMRGFMDKIIEFLLFICGATLTGLFTSFGVWLATKVMVKDIEEFKMRFLNQPLEKWGLDEEKVAYYEEKYPKTIYNVEKNQYRGMQQWVVKISKK